MSLSLGGVPRERSRTLDIVRPYIEYTGTTISNQGSFTFRTGEFTSDENHIVRDEFRKYHGNRREFSSFIDVGGPFFNEKTTYEDSGRIYSAFTGSGQFLRSFRGPQLPYASTLVDRTFGTGTYWNPVVTASSELELNSFGTSAISQTAPVNPHAHVLTAISELYRDGLPSAVGVKTIRDKDVGSEFLNYQFGIAPLLADLKDLHKSLGESEKILNQYLRDSGRRVRRRYEQPETVESSMTSSVGSANLGRPSVAGTLYDGSTSGTTRTTTTTIKSKKWFSGCFTYHAQLPSGTMSGIERRLREYNILYGILPTPEVLWNLTPWSWAADWVANIGDVLNNVSMFQSDGLVLLYGYVMEHKTITRQHHTYGYSLKNGGAVNEVQTFTSEVKTRRKASPFGFGLKPVDFSSRQWAILAALGLSRGRGIAF